MFNVFIDTTELYNDPFLKNNHNRILLKLSQNGIINIIISKLVLLETENHVKEKYEEISNDLKTIKNKIDIINHKSSNVLENVKINIDDKVTQFNNYYNELKENKVIEIIDIDNNLLPEVIDRAIKSKKPSSKHKNEFRDCIIWLSYAHYIKSNYLDDTLFITNNTSDFYNKEKDQLHDELMEDINPFDITLYKSTKELFDKKVELLKSLESREELENIREQVDFDFLTNYLNNNDECCLFDEISNYISELDIDKFVYGYNMTGTPELANIENIKISMISTEIIEKLLLVNGEAELICDVDINCYNPSYNDVEDKYFCFDSISVKFQLLFSLYVDENKKISDFEIDQISEITKPQRGV